MKSYSQHEQDIWVVNKLKSKRNGFFVEAGAGNGIRLSNTYLLETEYEWDGICVEPFKPNFDQLVKNRKSKSVCCLLDGEFGTQTYCSGVVPIDKENPQGYRGGIVASDTDNRTILNDSIEMSTIVCCSVFALADVAANKLLQTNNSEARKRCMTDSLIRFIRPF